MESSLHNGLLFEAPSMAAPAMPPQALHFPYSSISAGSHGKYGQFFCNQSANVPDDLLERPPDHQQWVRCFLSSNCVTSVWQLIDSLNTAHIVGKVPRQHYQEVAMTERCLEWLLFIGLPIWLPDELGWSYDLTKPSEGEIDVFGAVTAKKKAAQQFIETARGAILSGRYGLGLVRYYLDNTTDKSVLATFMWDFLLGDLSAADLKSRKQLLQHWIFVSLHSASPESVPFLENLEDVDLASFRPRQEFGTEDRWPLEDPDAELHLASLCRGMLESVTQTQFSHQYFNGRYSAEDNLRMISLVLDHTADSNTAPFGSLDQETSRWMLSRCKAFQAAGDVDVALLAERIRNHVPTGFQMLPPHLAHTIQLTTASAMEPEMSRTYSLAPSLRQPDNDLLVFLCCCFLFKIADPAICGWAASVEGSDCHQRILQGLHRQESEEQTALRMLALLGFESFLPPRPEDTIDPVHGCYLEDFCKYLKGEKLSNRRTLVQQMCLSLRRVIAGRCGKAICGFFHGIGTGPPRPTFASLLDFYWEEKVSRKSGHEGAWKDAWERAGTLMSIEVEGGWILV